MLSCSSHQIDYFLWKAYCIQIFFSFLATSSVLSGETFYIKHTEKLDVEIFIFSKSGYQTPLVFGKDIRLPQMDRNGI